MVHENPHHTETSEPVLAQGEGDRARAKEIGHGRIQLGCAKLEVTKRAEHVDQVESENDQRQAQTARIQRFAERLRPRTR